MARVLVVMEKISTLENSFALADRIQGYFVWIYIFKCHIKDVEGETREVAEEATKVSERPI
jgi:hypothetical protein